MDFPIPSIVEELKRQHGLTQTWNIHLKRVLDAGLEFEKRLQEAVTALEDGPPKARSSGAKKSCPGKEDVIPVLEDLLQSNESLPRDTLEEFASDRLRKAGWNLSGFVHTFPAALKDARFQALPSGEVALASNAKSGDAFGVTGEAARSMR